MRQAAIALIVEVARCARRAVIPLLFSRTRSRRGPLFSPAAGVLSMALGAFAMVSPAPALATIRYEVSVAHPGQHRFHVAMVIPGVHGNILVQMPAWNALYQVRDFAYRV